MCSLSHAVRRFNRFEPKYLVHVQAAEGFRRLPRHHRVTDDHGDSTGCYDLSSLHHDSPNLWFYWEKVDGGEVPA